MKRRPDFDRSVYFTIGIMCLLSIVICGYKLIGYEDCTTVSFSVNAAQTITGRLIRFIDLTPGARAWEWDFGDSSTVSHEKSPLHIYNRAGTYEVSLRVNGRCYAAKKLTVFNDRPSLPDSANFPRFSAPLTATVGETVYFADNTPGSQRWQWSFGESLRPDDTTRAPGYTYRTPGIKTVTLVVNGREQYRTSQRITVFAKPLQAPAGNMAPRKSYRYKAKEEPQVSAAPLPPPITPVKEEKAPELSRIQLENWLMQISEEKLTPIVLQPYVCNSPDIPVRVNGKSSTLKAFCNEIRGKKIMIRNLDMSRNEENGCITYIRIDYKRKKVLGIF